MNSSDKSVLVSRHREAEGRGDLAVTKRLLRRFAPRNDSKIRLAALFILLTGVVGQARADVKPGDQGLGLVLGSPIGLTYKYWYSKTMAVDGGIGAIGNNVALYATHLWHDFTLLPKPARWDGQLPFYFGLGARARFPSDSNFGARTIVGISFMHNQKPFEIFGEVGPFLRLAPDVGVSIDGGIGFRYYFKAL